MRSSEHKRRRAIRVMAARLARFPLGRHPALRVNPTYEGYRCFAFGGAAGPDISADNIFHELAHAVEFGPDEFTKRASPFGFVFKNNRVEVLGQSYVEPQTWQSTAREVRTMAIQLHLLRTAGYKGDTVAWAKEHLRSMAYMTDWYMVPGKTEEKRNAFLLKEFLKAYELLTAEMVLYRLELWLDKTVAKVKRLSKNDKLYFKNWTVFRLDPAGQFVEEPAFG